MSLEQIAGHLQQARKAKGLSQRKLADLVGIPQNHISKIENGQVDIRLSSLLALAGALDLELSLASLKESQTPLQIQNLSPTPTTIQQFQPSPQLVEIARQSRNLRETCQQNHSTDALTQFFKKMDETGLHQKLQRLNEIGRSLNDGAKLSDEKPVPFKPGSSS